MGSELDEGIGLVEVVVAMFLFAIFSLAFLPVLIQGLQISAENGTKSAGVQRMQDMVEQARASSSSCVAVAALDSSDYTYVDARNIEVEVVVTPVAASACPTGASNYPTTVPFSVSVTRTDTDVVLAQSKTLIFVTAHG